jgi:putative peptidoglycan lipid II flippase
MLAEPVLSVLFQWGRFGVGDVAQAAKVLYVSAAALPFYALSAYLVKAFHSRKQMKPPLFAGIVSFVVNLGLSLFLMNRYGVIGLAWANVGSSCAQTLILLIQLKNVSLWDYLKPAPFYVLSIMISSAGMAGGLYILEPLVAIDDSQAGSLWKLCLLIPAGVLTNFFFLFAFGFPEAGSAARKIRDFCRKLFG